MFTLANMIACRWGGQIVNYPIMVMLASVDWIIIMLMLLSVLHNV